MAEKRASNEEFFNQLGSLIGRVQAKGHGSVFLTQKRLTTDTTSEQTNPLADLETRNPTPILIRISDGNTQTKDRVKSKSHIKISTVVQPDELEAFFVRYAEVCKTGMQSLKKRDRSKRKSKKKTTTKS